MTPWLQAWAGVLAVKAPVALAGVFAASLFGFERAPAYEQPEFVIPDNRTGRHLPGLSVGRIRRAHWDVVWRQGLPTVPTPMLLRQVAAASSYARTRDVVQHALRRRQVTEEQLLAQLGRGLAGSAHLRGVLEELAPGYQVMWERRLHRALLKVGVRLTPQTLVRAPDGRKAYLDLGDERLRFGVEIDGFLNHMARFAADRRRARLLALELGWTIAPYAVEELADGMSRVVDEIATYVMQRRAA